MDCLYWLLVCLIGLLPVPSRTQDYESEDEKARALMADFWNWHLREFPEFASEIGIKDYDDKLTEYTEEAFERRATNATRFLKAINDINHSLLDYVTRTSLRVMEDSISTYLEGFRFRFLTAYQRFQMGMANPVVMWNYLLSRMKFETEEDYNRLLTRYSLIPNQVFPGTRRTESHVSDRSTFTGDWGYQGEFEQLINLTAQAMQRGYMRNTEGIDQYTASLAGHMVPVKDSIFYQPFDNMPSTFNVERRASFQLKAESLIRDKLLPAIWNMWFFISKKYAKAAKNVPIGLYGLSEGRLLYRRYLNYHLSLPMTPEQLHQLGLSEVKKVKMKISKLQADLNHTGDMMKFVQSFVENPIFYYNDSDAMLDSYKDLSNRVHGELDKILLYVTHSPYVIIPTYSGPPGSYEEDNDEPSRFYANVRQPYGPNFTMPAILLHETTPGHHTEAKYMKERNSTLPHFRRTVDFTNTFAVPFHFPRYTAYTEGWGMYAEYLGDVLGCYEHPASLLGSYMSEMLRACRLVVDTGIHAYGWTRKASEEYLSNHTFFSSEDVKTEVSRYIQRPGQACSYKIGQMKILELRASAENILGDRFDLRHFHHKFLSLGPVPLQILEEEMNSWISATIESGQGTYNTTSAAIEYHYPCFSSVLFSVYIYILNQYHHY